MMNWENATVVPMAQLAEIIFLSDFAAMMVGTMNSQFSQKAGNILGRKLRNNNNTLQF